MLKVGERTFLCTKFNTARTWELHVFVEKGEYYRIETHGRRLRLAELEFAPGEHLDRSELFPRVTATFPPRLASLPLADDSFFKQSGVRQYNTSDPDSLASSTYHLKLEVATLELLKKHPHPSICEYRGCMVEEGFTTGIVLKDYPECLSYSAGKVDHQMVLRDIGNAIQHLHSLGIIHNDINPGNIMLPADDSRAVLIDFDSAIPEGYRFNSKDRRYTARFSLDVLEVSERRNDLYGLERIRMWLEDPKSVE
ncbi:hypothetical protein P7C70_g3707, partial [Phenoliferia sp. Uapishka_3]